MATLDHTGLNRYIYMSASIDEMTLGSFNLTNIINQHSQSILGSNLDDSRLLLGINLYKNGPYGHSSWQQIRLSQNPISRYLRKTNQFSIVENGKERVYFEAKKRHVVADRHGKQRLYDEPPVVSCYKPLRLVGTIDDYNDSGGLIPKKFRKRISMNNNVSFFSNENINRITGLIEKDDEYYDILKDYYLEDALNIGDSPLSSFEKLVFRQTVYPAQIYTYKSYTRTRTNFIFSWNKDINKRQRISGDGFTITRDETSPKNDIDAGISSSFWPLDISPEWLTSGTSNDYHGVYITSSTATYMDQVRYAKNTSSSGILWNQYSQISFALGDQDAGVVEGDIIEGPGIASYFFFNLNYILRPAPLYSRRHTLTTKNSVCSPSGKISQRTSYTAMSKSMVYYGEAFWDTPRQSGKYPFYDSYQEASDEIRLTAKDYSIVPEFRMSEHVPRFVSSSLFNPPAGLLELTGGKSNCYDSSKKEFYKIYTNSDFLKNFDIILDDHKDFTDPSKITLICKAIKKLIPYDGFYPAQRTVKLAEQFYSSYSDYFAGSTGKEAIDFSGFINKEMFHSAQNIMTPLFAPGVLFNTIKSGVACDYPILTTELVPQGLVQPPYGNNSVIQNNLFDKRIPFEALVEPEKHLANYNLICNEPDMFANVSSSVYWSGQGNILYSKMANNFLAEIPNFFMKDGGIVTLASSPQNDPNFGQVKIDDSLISFHNTRPEAYSMRVKMYRTMTRANTAVTGAHGAGLYIPPQDIIKGVNDPLSSDFDPYRENITMYSRPTAFGPETHGTYEVLGEAETLLFPDEYLGGSNKFVGGSVKGFNFPFTPPYYHGQAWADIVFKPTQSKKYTVAEILSSCSVSYTRFDEKCYTTLSITASGGGPQQLNLINQNAMQLNSSVNLFLKGNLGENSTGMGINVQIDDQSKSRWIIQPKFETPILNFNHLNPKSVGQKSFTLPTGGGDAERKENMISQIPIGMWGQYGKIPSNTEGIYLQVTDIPRAWVENRLGYDYEKTGSLAKLCGFSQEPVKLGQLGDKKKISECVVAIPFIEESGVKKFFNLKPEHVKEAVEGSEKADQELIDLIDKMKRFIFPPSFDYYNYPDKVDPIAMYVFEFSSYLSQEDLSDIWQNVLPNIGRSHEEARSSISHSLLGPRKLINRSTLREDIRWMVFKVKQRAASRYYDQVYTKSGNKLTDIVSEVTADSAGSRSKIQYNWPYDFFSLVELIKIDASVQFSDIETDDNGKETVKSKVAKEKNRSSQLDTLFPKGKK